MPSEMSNRKRGQGALFLISLAPLVKRDSGAAAPFEHFRSLAKRSHKAKSNNVAEGIPNGRQILIKGLNFLAETRVLCQQVVSLHV